MEKLSANFGWDFKSHQQPWGGARKDWQRRFKKITVPDYFGENSGGFQRSFLTIITVEVRWSRKSPMKLPDALHTAHCRLRRSSFQAIFVSLKISDNADGFLTFLPEEARTAFQRRVEMKAVPEYFGEKCGRFSRSSKSSLTDEVP